MARPHQPDQATFRSILPEEINWQPFPAFPPAEAANAPVCRLLGGGAADLPVYASLVRYSEPSLVRAAVRRAIEAG